MTDGGDILAAIDQAVAEHEQCPCGRDLPEDCPSSFWCSEACQISWTRNQQDPAAHSHPRDIRAQQDQIRADAIAARAAVRAREQQDPGRPVPRPPGGPHTPVTGLAGWVAADPATAAVCQYLRWCPTCDRKRETVLRPDVAATAEPAPYSILESRPDVQECGHCRYAWPGRPLVGVVEQYRDLIRLRMTDGFRSAQHALTRLQLERWRAPAVCLELEWERLEEALCDGVTDRRRQENRDGRLSRRGQSWNWMAFPVIVNDPRAIIRATDT